MPRMALLTGGRPTTSQLAAYCGRTVEELEQPPELLRVVACRNSVGRRTAENSVRLKPSQLDQFIRLGGPTEYFHVQVETSRGQEKAYWVPVDQWIDLRTQDGFVLFSYKAPVLGETA